MLYRCLSGVGDAVKSYGLLPSRIRTCVGVREGHSVRRDRKSQTENDSCLVDPNLTMWRSINAEHKEVEQVPTDQSENIMNYYKDRWVQEQKHRQEMETVSGNEIKRDQKQGDSGSLYSQLAKKIIGMGHSHPGMTHQSYGFGDSRNSYDQFKQQKMAIPHDLDDKNRSNRQCRPTDNQSYWSTDKTQFQSGTSTLDTASEFSSPQPGRDPKIPDVSGPYRPTFSMANLVGGKSESAPNKSNKADGTPADLKAANRNLDATKENHDNKETSSSFTFQSAAPPSPDFKSS